MEQCDKKNLFRDVKNFLPAETRAYVMNFIALNVIFHNYDKFSKNTLCFRDEICLEDTAEFFPVKPGEGRTDENSGYFCVDAEISLPRYAEPAR